MRKGNIITPVCLFTGGEGREGDRGVPCPGLYPFPPSLYPKARTGVPFLLFLPTSPPEGGKGPERLCGVFSVPLAFKHEDFLVLLKG